MKYVFMKTHAAELSIEKIFIVLEVSRSGYYRFIYAVPLKRLQEDERLLLKMKSIHKMSRDTYGTPRIYAARKKKTNCALENGHQKL